MIRDEIRSLTKPVNLKVFTSSERLQESAYMMKTLDIYKSNSNGNLTIEEYKLDISSNLANKYDIQRTPVILLINDQGVELIRYLAVPRGVEIKPFVQSLKVFAGAPNYYKPMIISLLDKINPSTIQVMITESCAYCPTVLSICTQLALASEGKIKTRIIDIMAHPDIGEKYNISTVPYIIVNDKRPLVGNVGAEQIMNQLLNKDL